MIKLLIILFFLTSSLAFAAEPDSKTIKIGGAFALSGFASVWGEADRNGAILAIEEMKNHEGLRGTKLELVVEDIQSDNARTVTAVQKLLHVDEVNFIVGPTWADTFAGALPLLERQNVISISPSASITAMRQEQDFKYIFGTWYRTRDESEELLKYFAANNIKTIALMFGNDPFWQEIAGHIRELAPQHEISITRDITKPHNDLDFRTDLIRLRIQAPDALVFGLDNEQALLALLRQRAELASNIPAFTTESIEGYIEQDSFARYLNGISYVTPTVEGKDFVKRYRERFKTEPVFSAANSYDATKMLLQAVAEGHTSAESVREYLLSAEFETISFGKAKFAEDQGLTGGNFVIKEITEAGAKATP